MITSEDALYAQEFHAEGGCRVSIGPRGGITIVTEEWRRNGRTRTWKRDPARMEVPIKYGMYDYGTIRLPADASVWHTYQTCPLRDPARHEFASGAKYGRVNADAEPLCLTCDRTQPEHVAALCAAVASLTDRIYAAEQGEEWTA